MDAIQRSGHTGLGLLDFIIKYLLCELTEAFACSSAPVSVRRWPDGWVRLRNCEGFEGVFDPAKLAWKVCAFIEHAWNRIKNISVEVPCSELCIEYETAGAGQGKQWSWILAPPAAVLEVAGNGQSRSRRSHLGNIGFAFRPSPMRLNILYPKLRLG